MKVVSAKQLLIAVFVYSDVVYCALCIGICHEKCTKHASCMSHELFDVSLM